MHCTSIFVKRSNEQLCFTVKKRALLNRAKTVYTCTCIYIFGVKRIKVLFHSLILVIFTLHHEFCALSLRENWFSRRIMCNERDIAFQATRCYVWNLSVYDNWLATLIFIILEFWCTDHLADVRSGTAAPDKYIYQPTILFISQSRLLLRVHIAEYTSGSFVVQLVTHCFC